MDNYMLGVLTGLSISVFPILIAYHRGWLAGFKRIRGIWGAK